MKASELKVGQRVKVSDEPDATLYRVAQVDGFIALIEYPTPRATWLSGGWVDCNVLTLVKDVEVVLSDDTEAYKAVVKALETAYTVLGRPGHRWPSRNTEKGQRLLCDMRDALAQATGRTDEEVQKDYPNRSWA
jgi:hypothetical protein